MLNIKNKDGLRKEERKFKFWFQIKYSKLF